MVTPEGENHPIMRIGDTAEDTRKLWAALPALAASAPLGGPRPGATVLAVTAAPGGGTYPVVAVQRYGRGRSMVFAGEASWRWKMMLASTDRTHEFFWRQAARWLATPAPDPVTITVPESPEPGDAMAIDVDARDAAFAPVPDATVDATLDAARRRAAAADAAPRRLGERPLRRRPSAPSSPGCIACTPTRAAARRRSATPTAGSTSAAAIASSPIRG